MCSSRLLYARTHADVSFYVTAYLVANRSIRALDRHKASQVTRRELFLRATFCSFLFCGFASLSAIVVAIANGLDAINTHLVPAFDALFQLAALSSSGILSLIVCSS